MSVHSRHDADGDTITVTRSDGWFVARDESTGVASQGETKVAALKNLVEALQLHRRPVPDDVDGEPEASTAPWH